MSLTDQKWCLTWTTRILFGSGIVGFLLGLSWGSFQYTAYTVAVALLFCHVLVIPNWRQTPDPTVTWVSEEAMTEYYNRLEAAKDEMYPETAGKRPPIRPSTKAVAAPEGDPHLKTE